jgi:Flp pilus assembly protein TadB
LLGGQLPSRYQDWVAQDLLTDGWRHRQSLRLLLLSAPFAIVFLLLPGSLTVRVTAAIVVLLFTLGLGYLTGNNFRDRRLRQHGLEPPPPDEKL